MIRLKTLRLELERMPLEIEHYQFEVGF